jgi:hypothetical protein
VRELERAEGDPHAASGLAGHVLGRHAHVLEDGRALDAELVVVAADREAGAVGVDDERRHARDLTVGDRKDDGGVGDAGVADPVLGAVLGAVDDTAMVRIAAAFEPASASASANAGSHTPDARRGRNRLWNSGKLQRFMSASGL